MPAFTGARRVALLDMPPLLLDKLSGAAAAYGLRRLQNAYRGAAIRIRRSSDNAEMDIGFSANALDIVSLLKFVGGGDGSISTWYDQSGNGKHAVSTARPTLVSSGVLQTMNGKPAALFAGASYLTASAVTVPQPYSEYAVVSPTNTAVGIVAASTTGDSALYTEDSVVKTRSTGLAIFSTKVPIGVGVGNILSLVQNGASSLVCANGGYLNGTISTAGIIGLEIGSWQGGGLPYSGKISELIIFPSAHATEMRRWVEFSLMNAYGIRPMESYVLDGDSLTAGAESTGGNTYPAQFMASIPGANFSINDGVGGATLLDMASDAPTTIDNQVYALGQPVNLIVWGGTNDMYVTGGGYTPAQTYAHLKTYVAARKATGKYSRIVVMTSIPRESDTANRFAYNDLIRAGMQPGGDLLAAGASMLCDLQQLSAFDNANDVNDTNIYNGDLTHLTNTGYGLPAAALKATLGL